jgi:hypothetical protein
MVMKVDLCVDEHTSHCAGVWTVHSTNVSHCYTHPPPLPSQLHPTHE